MHLRQEDGEFSTGAWVTAAFAFTGLAVAPFTVPILDPLTARVLFLVFIALALLSALAAIHQHGIGVGRDRERNREPRRVATDLLRPEEDQMVGQPRREAVGPASEAPPLPISVADERPATTSPTGPKFTSLADGRVVVCVTPQSLVSFFASAGLTSQQASALVAPYLGKLMDLAGSILDVHTEHGVTWATLEEYKSDPRLDFVFDAEWRDRLQLCRRGDQVRIRGEIASAGRHSINLRHCELVNAG